MQPSTAVLPSGTPDAPPDHTQLPDKDGSIVTNFQEHPQSVLLTGCLTPRLEQLNPDGNFIIGEDCGIYWRYTNPPLKGCKSPDWYYVSGVPPMLDGQIRRSYVLWKEGVRPLIAIEYVSGDGTEEHDETPYTGKFWVYEQGICIPFYAIFDGFHDTIELYTLRYGRYEPIPANAAGRYPVAPLGVELGLWHARYRGMEGTWLRVWDIVTNAMLPSLEERAEVEKERAEVEKERAEAAESVAEELGRDLAEECERAETERKRANLAEKQAEAETKRADLADQQSVAVKTQLENLHERLRAMGLDPEALP